MKDERACFESRIGPTAAAILQIMAFARKGSSPEIGTLGAATHFAAISFDAETTRAMGVAFDMACRSLQLSDVADPLTRIVASKIVDTASAGEHDAIRLHDAVMRWVATA